MFCIMLAYCILMLIKFVFIQQPVFLPLSSHSYHLIHVQAFTHDVHHSQVLHFKATSSNESFLCDLLHP